MREREREGVREKELKRVVHFVTRSSGKSTLLCFVTLFDSTNTMSLLRAICTRLQIVFGTVTECENTILIVICEKVLLKVGFRHVFLYGLRYGVGGGLDSF